MFPEHGGKKYGKKERREKTQNIKHTQDKVKQFLKSKEKALDDRKGGASKGNERETCFLLMWSAVNQKQGKVFEDERKGGREKEMREDCVVP